MRRAVGTAMLVLGALVGASGTATAQAGPSPGCQALNDPAFDVMSTGGEVGPVQFFAGETVTVTAGPPSTLPGAFLRFVVSADSAIVDFQQAILSSASPSHTFSYTFPSDGVYRVFWVSGFGTEVTWSVQCTAAAYPLAVSAPRLSTDAATVPAAHSSSSSGSHVSLGAVALVAGAVVVQLVLGVGLRRGGGRHS